jgi:hypothetical protein
MAKTLQIMSIRVDRGRNLERARVECGRQRRPNFAIDGSRGHLRPAA